MPSEIIQFASYPKKEERDILRYLVTEKLVLYRNQGYLQENFIFSETGKKSLFDFINQGLGDDDIVTHLLEELDSITRDNSDESFGRRIEMLGYQELTEKGIGDIKLLGIVIGKSKETASNILKFPTKKR